MSSKSSSSSSRSSSSTAARFSSSASSSISSSNITSCVAFSSSFSLVTSSTGFMGAYTRPRCAALERHKLDALRRLVHPGVHHERVRLVEAHGAADGHAERAALQEQALLRERGGHVGDDLQQLVVPDVGQVLALVQALAAKHVDRVVQGEAQAPLLAVRQLEPTAEHAQQLAVRLGLDHCHQRHRRGISFVPAAAILERARRGGGRARAEPTRGGFSAAAPGRDDWRTRAPRAGSAARIGASRASISLCLDERGYARARVGGRARCATECRGPSRNTLGFSGDDERGHF